MSYTNILYFFFFFLSEASFFFSLSCHMTAEVYYAQEQLKG